MKSPQVMTEVSPQAHLATGLAAAWRRRFGDDVEIDELVPLSAGTSSHTWRFVARGRRSTQKAILQLFAGARQFAGALDKRTQGRVQQAAFDGGIPVARVLLILDEADRIGEGYVSVLLEGETLGQRIVHSARFERARMRMAQQCGEILAGIHRLAPTGMPPLPLRQAAESVKLLGLTHRSYGQSIPVFELAIQWLEDHLPPQGEVRLVHGDFRTGNLLVGEEGIVAVLDWEMAHLGDPMEDLGWLCVNSWRFGRIDRPVGGFGDRAALYQAYERASGVAVDPERVRFWQIFGSLQWGVVCQWFAFQAVSGELESLERAAIGRRMSETQIDLLDLLERKDD